MQSYVLEGISRHLSGSFHGVPRRKGVGSERERCYRLCGVITGAVDVSRILFLSSCKILRNN